MVAQPVQDPKVAKLPVLPWESAGFSNVICVEVRPVTFPKMLNTLPLAIGTACAGVKAAAASAAPQAPRSIFSLMIFLLLADRSAQLQKQLPCQRAISIA